MVKYVQNIFRVRLIAILLIAAGYGWSGGHFIPAGSPWFAYLFQIIVLLILFVLSFHFFSISGVQRQTKATIGLTIFAILSLSINIVNIIHGAMNIPSSSFGSHNTLADLVPICIIIAGNLLWLLTLFPFKKP